MALTTVQSGMMDSVAQYYTFKNRLINGAMVIDQRNSGASVTNIAGGVYPIDRWQAFGSAASKYTVQRNAGSVTPPAGFTNYLGITSSSAYTVGAGETFCIFQYIEGFNTADLMFGTANAATVTLSFWVRSSLTGTFGGSLRNSGETRSYPFSYTISAANTWEQKSITIAGDTAGTWVGATNGIGLEVLFSVGTGSTLSGTSGSWATANYISATGATSVVGTNGATFYITGVQIEKGVTATSFDYRPYTTEQSLCYRYYRRYTGSNANYTALGIGVSITAVSIARWGFTLDIPMRTVPVPSFTNCFGWNGTVGGAITASTNYSSTNYVDMDLTTSGLTATSGLAAKVLILTTAGYIELNGCEL